MGLLAAVLAHGGAITGDEIAVIAAGATLLLGALAAARWGGGRGEGPTRDESGGPDQ